MSLSYPFRSSFPSPLPHLSSPSRVCPLFSPANFCFVPPAFPLSSPLSTLLFAFVFLLFVSPFFRPVLSLCHYGIILSVSLLHSIPLCDFPLVIPRLLPSFPLFSFFFSSLPFLYDLHRCVIGMALRQHYIRLMCMVILIFQHKQICIPRPLVG